MQLSYFGGIFPIRLGRIVEIRLRIYDLYSLILLIPHKYALKLHSAGQILLP